MLTENAKEILEARYLKRDSSGLIVESPEQMFKRTAKAIAAIEKEEKEKWEVLFYKVMANLEFLPNSPTLMNAGFPEGQLSACFVLPVNDSMESIFTTLKLAALIHKSGGGTGYNFSNLRPKGDLVTSYGGTSSGPLAFMHVYDVATESVKQGGKRRGANMGILNVDHSDVMDFISIKSKNGLLRNFNISVGVTDQFMEAVISNQEWQLVNPRTKKVTKTLKARFLWDSIIEEAWKTGDPGLIFMDTINRYNPVPNQGQILCTNPCGEVPLLEYESCNLGSINLSKMLKKNGAETLVDWDKLALTTDVAVQFLDNVISANHFPIKDVKNATINNRKIGLGVMGWAEMLIALDIPYASEEAVELGGRLMQFIQEKSYESSKKLAMERGNFPNWKDSIYYPDRPMRNATCNSIAPTGSISVIANTSYSIEPLYALAYRRVGILDNQTQSEIDPIFVKKMERVGLWTNKVKEEVLKTGSIQHLEMVPREMRKVFETSLEISWKYHLLHQKAFQKFTDNAVSKTINLHGKTTRKEISEIYKSAWEYGLKGITVYRDGSKVSQVLQTCNSNRDGEC